MGFGGCARPPEPVYAGHERTRKARREKVRASIRPMLDDGLGVCGEVDEKPKPAVRKAKVVHELRAVFFRQFRDSLYLDDIVRGRA